MALTTAGPVGVDIEQVLSANVRDMAPLCLAPTETVYRDGDFFTYWVRKESVVKATGDGLRVPLSQVVVSSAGEPARLRRYPGGSPTASMADLEVPPGYHGAVTVLTAEPLRVTVNRSGSDGGGMPRF